jgi:hypothetical protein
VLLLREAAGGMEIFMVQRNRQIEFSSGALVFPGGSMDPNDREAADSALVADRGGLDSIRLRSVSAASARRSRKAEFFWRARGSSALVSADKAEALDSHREALDEGKISFADVLREHDLVPAIDLLTLFAHWITPVNLPKRFDTHFLLALAPPDQIGKHDGKVRWTGLAVAESRARGGGVGRYNLPFPTIRNLIKLDKLGTAQAAMDYARATPVVTVVPR